MYGVLLLFEGLELDHLVDVLDDLPGLVVGEVVAHVVHTAVGEDAVDLLALVELLHLLVGVVALRLGQLVLEDPLEALEPLSGLELEGLQIYATQSPLLTGRDLAGLQLRPPLPEGLPLLLREVVERVLRLLDPVLDQLVNALVPAEDLAQHDHELLVLRAQLEHEVHDDFRVHPVVQPIFQPQQHRLKHHLRLRKPYSAQPPLTR